MTDTAHVFAEIIKTAPQDDGSLLVQGKACDSSLDLDQQICDPKWLARAMPAWFEVGNVREQHDPRRAVGKATEYDARDDGHYITAKIVDPLAKAKCEAGIFSGFSIGVKGPRIAKSKSAPGGVIHDGKIIEVSLVDRPANPNSTLTLVKAASAGWEGKADDLDDERGLVHVEELHLAEAGEPTDEPEAEKAEGDDPAEMDDEAAAAVLAIDKLASVLDIAGADRPAALADAIEKASQADDIAGAQEAIGIIGGLIASEASELVTCPGEAYDIRLLLEATEALRRFIYREENEAATPEVSADVMERRYLAADLGKRKWSKAERDRAAKEGHARPDGSFPIETAEDVRAAVHLARSPEDRAWVKKRARAVGAESEIPDTWKGAMSDDTTTDTTAGAEQAGPEGDAAKSSSPTTTDTGAAADAAAGQEGTDKGAAPADKADAPPPGDTPKTDDSGSAAEGKDGEDATKGSTPDLVKALTTALADPESELHKTMNAIVKDSTKSTTAAITDLAGRMERVEQMATPGGPALRRTESERATARHGDLQRQHAHYKALAANAEDPDLRAGYHTKAAEISAELKTLGAALATT